jgi:hypothetical protein
VLCHKNNVEFFKKPVLEEIVAKLGIQKQLWLPKVQTFLEINFFCAFKGSNKKV